MLTIVNLHDNENFPTYCIELLFEICMRSIYFALFQKEGHACIVSDFEVN